MKRILGTAAVASLATGFLTLSATAEAAASPSAEPMTVHRKSNSCNSPRGKNFNISWSDSGNVSTTFYFNNHCNKVRRIRVFARANAGNDRIKKWACIKVNPHTKGRKKIYHTGHNVWATIPKKRCWDGS